MKKYKIVVLSDLNDSISTTLKSSVSLAKMINGDIEVFSVKKPTDIVGKDNQLSAMRTINNEHSSIDRKMQKITEKISKNYGMDIKHSFAFGNVKNEIGNFIKSRQPDIIVLGKKKSKPFNLIGDGIIQFVLNTFKGVIMISANKNALEPDKEISLGMLNSLDPSFNLEFSENLMAHAQRPLKSFKVVKNHSKTEDIQQPGNKDTIEYVFENNDRIIKSLSNYVLKNNINVLYLDRDKKSAADEVDFMTSDIKTIVNNLNVNLLMAGGQKV